MAHPVFISYARSASQKQAEALHQALGGRDGLAFLDSSGIEPTERFPRVLADALLGARVVVIFASKDYFRRWYCLWELEAALGPFLALGPTATEAQKEATLAPLLVVLPEQGNAVPELSALPPALQVSHWPTANALERVVDMVRASLARVPQTLQERLAEVGQPGAALRHRLLEEAALPPPGSLATHPVSPRSLPPSLGGSFVGRADDLWRIHYTLTVLRDLRGEGVAGAALTGALHGAGGFGKTRLALEYLYRFGPRHHRGGLFWVNAEVGPERLEEQFHGILRTLRPDEVPDLVEFRESQRNAAAEMAEALESIAARERVLYVVDNVPEPRPDERPKPLETWCPSIGKVSLLATSRARLDLGTEGVHALPVFTLSPGAAVDLLTEGIDRAALEDAGWQRIAEWVGYLPLALELLNRTLKAGALEPRELHSRARSQEPTRELDRQMKLLERHVPSSSLRGITEAFSISYARLSKAEQRAARLIAQLAPEPLPMELVEALGPEVLPPDVRATLRTRHFVTSVEAAGEVRMFGGMHRVLADYLRGQSRSPVSELRQLCEGIVVLMQPSTCRDPRAWPLLKACLPHAERVFERLVRVGRHSLAGELFRKLLRPLGKTRKAPAEFWLGVALGVYLSEKGCPAQARSFEERVVEHVVSILGPEHPDTLMAMNNLALTLQVQGDLQASREQQELVLNVMRRVLGEEHLHTLAAMNNLALTLRAQGDLQGARALQEQVLGLVRRVLGEEHPHTLTTMGNLALTLRAQGDLQGAHEQQKRVVEMCCRVMGAEHPTTLTAMSNLAGTFHLQGALTQARALEERVLEGRRQLLGVEHPDTLLAIDNLATTLRDQGDAAGAEALKKEALEIRQRQK